MKDQKYLVTREELTFGKTGFIPRTFSRLCMSALGINRANKVYNDTYYAEDYTEALLNETGISYVIDPKDAKCIPASGPVIVICNHPTGAMDGIVLTDILSKIRPDVKFMSNFLLNRIEPLRKYIIAVDPFDSKSRDKNVRGVRDSLQHLRDGGMLAIFPAGEVATWQEGFKKIRDKEWEESVIKFIRRASVPVVPMYIQARNSRMFRMAGKINPMLRTALLPHELFNKKGTTVRVISGSAILPARVEDLPEKQYANYLRANVDYLYGSRNPKKTISADQINEDLSDIADRLPIEEFKAEMEDIRKDYLLYDYNELSLFCAPPSVIPKIMHEIGRCREITFRKVGEGTQKPLDLDKYDEYYHQLFLWDNAANALVGGYRIGFGDEIIEKYGIKGFYTDSLFRFTDEMKPVLEKTIELGRSFISHEYQKRPVSLMLLWKGIVYVLLKHKQFRNMMGPVTISGEFRSSSKMIISGYLRFNHYNRKLSRFIRPVTGMKGIKAPMTDLSLIEGIDSIELIGKLVNDIEQSERPIPVLVKKYLGLSSQVLGFNVDPDFSDGLDALMLLDMKHVPEMTINMLSKEITDIDVIARFKNID